MAQILIRKQAHFAETVKPTEWSDLKWGGRPLRGDVVEVRENGFFRIEALGTGTHGWNREAFALIQITNLSLQQVAMYAGSYDNGTETVPTTVRFKNRYRLPNWEVGIPWIKNMVTVGGVTVEEWYYIRANIHSMVTPVDKVTV